MIRPSAGAPPRPTPVPSRPLVPPTGAFAAAAASFRTDPAPRLSQPGCPHDCSVATAAVAPAAEPPEDLCCPITLVLFEDPVTLSDGHVYSRAAIEDWLRRGNTTSPVTGDVLESAKVVPCHMAHSMVVRWCEANGVRPPTRK